MIAINIIKDTSFWRGCTEKFHLSNLVEFYALKINGIYVKNIYIQVVEDEEIYLNCMYFNGEEMKWPSKEVEDIENHFKFGVKKIIKYD